MKKVLNEEELTPLQTGIWDGVVSIINDVMDSNPDADYIALTDSLSKDWEFDSLKQAEFTVACENYWDIKIPDEDVFGNPFSEVETISDVVLYLEKAIA